MAASVSSIKCDWEPLPPRQSRRSNGATTKPSDSAPAKYAGTEGGESDQAKTRKRPRVDQYQNILDNISQRASVQKMETTLEQTDGVGGEFYEYLDHTADVQLHTWGATLVDAFQNIAPCMLNYQTDITKVAIDPDETINMDITGHDMESLLYNYMNELLFKFITDMFCAVKVEIREFDRDNFKISAILYGDIFSHTKHTSGTEIKAITYSNMQIHEKPGKAELFVIVDI